MTRRAIDERDALRRTVARQDARIRELEAERGAAVEREQALAAHVERLEDIIERSTLADSPAGESALEDTPETSLARLKAQWQAEVLEEYREELGSAGVGFVDCLIKQLRRQAEEVS